jgi:zinc/manganese transport system substrate-binding protein
MRKLILFLAALAVSSAAHATPLRVFSCEPEWTALLQEIAADRVNLYTATTGRQDVHKIQPRPSLLAAARRADLVVCTGADFEVGWLPVLLRQAGNPRIQPGGPGYIEAAMLVERIDIPERLDRAEGDLHPQGNPHVQMDARNIVPIARVLAERLVQLDPGNRAFFEQRLADFSMRWNEAIPRWENRAVPLKGVPLVQHEMDFNYLTHWLGMRNVAMLEPKAGLPPTAAHLARLLEQQWCSPPRSAARPVLPICSRCSTMPSTGCWLRPGTDIAMQQRSV